MENPSCFLRICGHLPNHNRTLYLPAGHVLAHLFCNWKGSKKLTVLLHLGAAEVDLITEPIAFIAACYESKVEGVMNTHHYQLGKYSDSVLP